MRRLTSARQILREIRMQHHKKLAPEEAVRFIQSWWVRGAACAVAQSKRAALLAANDSWHLQQKVASLLLPEPRQGTSSARAGRAMSVQDAAPERAG